MNWKAPAITIALLLTTLPLGAQAATDECTFFANAPTPDDPTENAPLGTDSFDEVVQLTVTLIANDNSELDVGTFDSDANGAFSGTLPIEPATVAAAAAVRVSGELHGHVWKTTLANPSCTVILNPLVFQNRAPTVQVMTVPITAHSSDDISILTSFADPDGDAIYADLTEYTWELKDGNDWLDTDSYDQVLPADYTEAGQLWRVSLTMSDGYGGFAVHSEEVRITDSEALPTANITTPDVSVLLDSNDDALPFTATDSTAFASHALRYRWDLDNDGFWDEDWTASPDALGGPFDSDAIAHVVLEVEDSVNFFRNRTSLDFTVNHAPVVDTFVLSPLVPSSTQDITVVVEVSDPDAGQTLTTSIFWLRTSDANSIEAETLEAIETTKGEEWTATASTIDGHGGLTNISYVFTIGNAAPEMSVDIQPAAPKTGDDLVGTATVTDPDGDTIDYCDVLWFVDDVATLPHTNQDDAPCDGSTFDSTYFVKGQTVTMKSSAKDADETSTQVAHEVVIGDTLPTLSVALPAQPTAAADLVPELEIVDPDVDDGVDTISCTFSWMHDAPLEPLHPHNGTSCSPTIPASQLIRGDTWSLTMNVTSGGEWVESTSATVTVANALPTLTNIVTPTNPSTKTDLTVTFDTFDADGDTVSTFYSWIRNDAPGDELSNTATLDSSLTSIGDYTLIVTLNDEYGTAEVEIPVEVVNDAPNATFEFPTTVKAGDAPTVFVSVTDDDDTELASCVFHWEHERDETVTIFDDEDCFLGEQEFFYPNTDTLKGDVLRAVVLAVDGDTAVEVEINKTKPIGNTIPTVNNVLTITGGTSDVGFAAVVTGDDEDGDDLTCEFQWSRTEPSAKDYYTNGACDEGLLPPSEIVRGEVWTLRALTYDGYDYSAPSDASDELTVLNGVPKIKTAALSSATPSVGDAVTVDVDCVDSDLDTVTVRVEWSRGVDTSQTTWHEVSGDDNSCMVTDTLDASLVNPHDTWTVVVNVTDGEGGEIEQDLGSLTFQNRAPPVTIDFSNLLPKTGDSVTASATIGADPDGDTLGTATYAWKLGATLIQGFTLPAASTAKGQQWTFTVSIPDTWNGGSGVHVITRDVVIQNTKPTAAGVTLTPITPGAGQDITASLTSYTDVDLDSVTATYQWKLGAVVQSTSKTLPGSLTTPGQVWTVIATPTDGTDAGNPVTASVTILAPDSDGDGVHDDKDNCIGVVNPKQENYDNDALGDACDDDDDNDGYSDLVELAAGSNPLNKAAIPGDKDGDTVPDGTDNCPDLPNANQKDIDSDGIGDVCDPDRDGDGFDNEVDGLPDDPRYHLDADKDGVADELDQCPGFDDKADLDQDGIADGCDIDDDGDGVPDGHDKFPRDKAESKDDDRDGIGNNADNCPVHSNFDQLDTDKDGIGDACDLDNTTPPKEVVDPKSPPKLEKPSKFSVALSKGKARLYFTVPPAPTSSHYLIWRFSTPELIGTVPVVAGKTDYSFDAGAVPDGEHHYGVIGIDSIEKKDAAIAMITGKELLKISPALTKNGYVGCPPGAFDQDRDGICDAVEVEMGLDPLNADTDGDGRLDGEEMLDLDGEGFDDVDSQSNNPTVKAAAKGGQPMWLWLVLGGFLLAAGGVVAGVLLWLKRKNEGTKASGSKDSTPAWAT